MKPMSTKTATMVVIFAAVASLIVGSLPASASVAAVVQFQGCTVILDPPVGPTPGSGEYSFQSSACTQPWTHYAGCNAVGVQTTPAGTGASTEGNCQVDAPPVEVPPLPNNTYQNIVCGTGTTGGGTAKTDLAQINETENRRLAGSSFSGAISTQFGIVFAGSIGVVIGTLTADDTGLGLAGQPVTGVLQISAVPPAQGNCVTGVTSFTATVVVTSAKA